jgi:hypothetical protein
LSQLGVPHTQNFEILQILEKLRTKKNLISFENFQKLLDGSKFGKKCLIGIFIQNFISDLENSKFSLRKS